MGKSEKTVIGLIISLIILTQVITMLISIKLIAVGINLVLTAVAVITVIILLNKQSKNLKDVFDKFSPDKFDENLEVDKIGELGELVESKFNGLRQTFKKQVMMSSNVSGISINLNKIASESLNTMNSINSFTETACGSSEKQTSMLGDIKFKTNEIIESIKEVSEDMNDTSKFTRESILAADKGIKATYKIQERMEDTKNIISDISTQIETVNKSSENVVNMTNLISSIASQTNMLALNAAIEAARAGEAGRGFTVVADEVGKLSMQTSDASNQIEEIVRKLNEDLVAIRETVKEKVDTLEEVYYEVVETINELKEINTALNTSVVKVEGVHGKLSTIGNHSDSVSSGINEISEFTEGLFAQMQESYGEVSVQNERLARLKDISDDLYSSAIKMQQVVIGDIMEEKMLEATKYIISKIATQRMEKNEVQKIADEAKIDSINITDDSGVITICNDDCLGLNLYEADPTFLDLKSGKKSFIATPIKSRIEDGKLFKFLAIIDKGRIYQVGLSIDSLIKY